MPVELHAVADRRTLQLVVRPPATVAGIPQAAAGTRSRRPTMSVGRRAEMELLGDRIAELSARIQAATYELLVLICQFDQREGWSGFTSCAHWLSWRAGLAPGAAREKVRVARALADLPLLSDALRRGRVSYSKVRAVTRVAAAETEQALLDVALAGTAAHVEQVVRAWRRVDRTAEVADERRRHASRRLHTWVDDDGMVVIRGQLTPEVGAMVRRALEAALDEERRAASERSPDESDPVDEAAGVAPSFGQRQADALGAVAECALAGGLDRGTAGDRYQVVLHVDADTLTRDVDVPAGTPSAHAETARPGSGDGKRDLAGNSRQMRRSSRECGGTKPGGGLRSGLPRPGGAGRSGWHPCLGGNRPAAGLRRRHRRDAAWSKWPGARCRPQEAHDLTGPAPGAGGPRPALPVSRLSGPPLRRASRAALGARRRHGARQSGVALPAASPGGARGRVHGQSRSGRCDGVRAAGRADVTGRTGCARLARRTAGAHGAKADRGGSYD